MFANRFVVGVIVGLPISVLCVLYTLLRRQYMVSGFKALDDSFGELPDAIMFWILLGMFALVGPGIGMLAGLVYGWVPSVSFYLGLVVGMAALMTIAALASRTPFMVEKIVLNFFVVLLLGLLLPRIVGGS